MAQDAKPFHALSPAARGLFAVCLALLCLGGGGEAWATSADTLRVAFVGDLLLDRGVREHVDTVGADALFSPSVDSLFARCQCVVANLECPATHLHTPMQKVYVFRGDPEHLPALRRHGITHLNLANNHSIDQGRRGLMDTRRHVEAAGIVPVGAGANMSDAAKPVLLARHPREVWLLTSLRLALENYAYLPERPCVSQEPFDTLLARVQRLRQQSPHAYIIVTLHWGGENTLKPILRQVVDAHRLADAGADLIVGHHPHTLQPIEHYRGTTIFYSIGNFIFDAHRPIHQKACAAVVAITADSEKVQEVPIRIHDCTPEVD